VDSRYYGTASWACLVHWDVFGIMAGSAIALSDTNRQDIVKMAKHCDVIFAHDLSFHSWRTDIRPPARHREISSASPWDRFEKGVTADLWGRVLRSWLQAFDGRTQGTYFSKIHLAQGGRSESITGTAFLFWGKRITINPSPFADMPVMMGQNPRNICKSPANTVARTPSALAAQPIRPSTGENATRQ